MWFSIAFPLLALVVSSAAQCPINDAATNLILDYEKFNSTPYDDGYGCWTLGYGHRCVPNDSSCQNVAWPVAEAQARTIFSQDVTSAETCLANALHICLLPNQYGALVSWTFNVGCGQQGMTASRLIRRMNDSRENVAQVAQEELPRWRKSGGKVSQGLWRGGIVAEGDNGYGAGGKNVLVQSLWSPWNRASCRCGQIDKVLRGIQVGSSFDVSVLVDGRLIQDVNGFLSSAPIPSALCKTSVLVNPALKFPVYFVTARYLPSPFPR